MRMIKEAHARVTVGAGGAGDEAAFADDEDGDCQAGPGARLPCRWRYAIALTKSDKGGPKALKRVHKEVRQALETTECIEPVAVVETSAKAKAGRQHMWRLMRCVVLPDEADGEAESDA